MSAMRGSSALPSWTPSPRLPTQAAVALLWSCLMRGSSLAAVVMVPETETQSCEELFWKVTWAVLSCSMSENLVECVLARKRKSGPSRWWEGWGC